MSSDVTLNQKSAGSEGDSKSNQTVLQLHGITKSFVRGSERVVALAGVDLAVDEGEFVALLGPSGAGKSTLLHLAGGLDEPDEGSVRMGGESLSGMSASARARLRRQRVGFIFQFFHLVPTLNVFENIALPILLDREKVDREAVRDLIARVDLAHRADHLPSQLSGGEMQRAAIARALVASPSLVIADEPTGNLDSATGREVLTLLRRQVTEFGTAVLMATHDPRAARAASRRVTLSDGCLV